LDPIPEPGAETGDAPAVDARSRAGSPTLSSGEVIFLSNRQDG